MEMIFLTGGIDMMKRKIIKYSIAFFIVLFILFNSSLYFPLRSYIVMFFYSKIHEGESLMNKHDIGLKIPGGLSTRNKDWYPFVMTFNDNIGFSRYFGKNTDLTILYNFGHFQLREGSSSYYNPSSSYFSSFYGGYLVKSKDVSHPPFGFNSDGSINIDEVSLVPKYDQEVLVLGSLGCPRDKVRFDVSIDKIEYDVNYIDYEGWTKVDSTIITNSPVHSFTENHTAYIQYGRPIEKYYNNEDFPIITLKGRTYVRHLKEDNISLFLYVLAPNMDTVEECDETILSKTKLDKGR